MPLARLSPRLLALIAFAAGSLAALGFAPIELWPLTIIGVAVFAALVDAAPTRGRAALWGWLFGVGHFATGLTWIATAFTFQAKMPAAVGWVAVIGLAMFLSIYTALAAGLARWLATSRPARVLVLAPAWMLGEWLRGWVLSGFAWNPLGEAWVTAPGIVQLAAFGGSLALSGLMIVAGGALWLAVVRAWRPAAAMGAAIAVAAIAGVALDQPVSAPGNPTVYLVQPNIGQDEKYAGSPD